MIRISISKKLNLPDGKKELIIDAELPLNQISAVYGQSGAGKTSLLNILAGLLTPEKGYIEINGKVWLDTNKNFNLPPQKRETGYVFQDYALFSNMTVKQNLLYAIGNNNNTLPIDHLLNLTGLTDFANHKPATLSGGQKQRAALARALVRKPALLLLDEPLSAIDAAARLQLQQEFLNLQQQYQFTALLVSHNTNEIIKLAAKVFCIENGRISKSGPPVDIFATKPSDNIYRATGLVVAVYTEDIDVLIGDQIIKVKKTAEIYQPGASITINFEEPPLHNTSQKP